MSDNQEIVQFGDDQPSARAMAVQPSQSVQIITAILDAARDPNIDAGKVETMANLAMRMQDREREEQFNRDLNAALMEMPRISKRGQITIPAKGDQPERVQGTFAKFEDIDRAVRPILARHNLTIRFKVGSDDGQTAVTPILTHANGYVDTGDAMRLPLDTSGSKNNTQGVGSSTSYGKRYAMCAALNIIVENEDDDGRGGMILPSDPPNDRQSRLVEFAEAAFAQSAEDYDAWYQTISARDRAWMVQSGNHGRITGRVTPMITHLPPAGGAGSAQRPAASTGGRQGGQTGKHDTQTAEGWTAQYVDDCAAAATLDQLAEIQRRGARALDKLKGGNPDLHRKAISAGGDAYSRLSAPAGDAATGGLFGGDE